MTSTFQTLRIFVLLKILTLIISAEEEDLRLYKKNCVPQALYKHIPDDNIFELFQDKHRANLSLQSNGIEIPKTLYNYQDCCESTAEKSYTGKGFLAAVVELKCMNKCAINRRYSFFSDHHITQEYINGELYTVDMLCE